MSHVKVQQTRFIDAEPGVILFPQPADEHGVIVSIPSPVVILSFGGEDGPIQDVAVSIVESRQMVIDILGSLAQMGDSLAQAITNQYFGSQQKNTFNGDTDRE